MSEERTKPSVPRETLEGYISRVQDEVVKAGLVNAKKRDADIYARAALKAITDIIAERKYFSIPGAFSLSPAFYEARTGHNPQKPGETVQIPAQWKTKIKLSPMLRKRMNEDQEAE